MMVAPIPQTSEELNECTWAQINDLACSAAVDPEPFLFMTDATHKIEKDIDLSAIGCSSTVKARIIGVEQDVDENSNKIGLTFQLCDGLARDKPTAMRMNASNATSGGWETCEMRTTNLPKIKDALPDDLKPLLKKIRKKTNMADSGTQMTESADELVLLSVMEVFGPSQNAKEWWPLEGEWYQWYENHNTNEDRIIHDMSGSAGGWWLRSVYSSASFCYVNTNGARGTDGASYSHLPCACFAIGTPPPPPKATTQTQVAQMINAGLAIAKTELDSAIYGALEASY